MYITYWQFISASNAPTPWGELAKNKVGMPCQLAAGYLILYHDISFKIILKLIFYSSSIETSFINASGRIAGVLEYL